MRSIEGAEVGEECQKVYEKAITVNYYLTEKLTVPSCKDGRVQRSVYICIIPSLAMNHRQESPKPQSNFAVNEWLRKQAASEFEMSSR